MLTCEKGVAILSDVVSEIDEQDDFVWCVWKCVVIYFHCNKFFVHADA